jgi:integrase
MASVKIVLRKKKNKDGTYPLAIRITKDRKSSYLYIGHHIQETFWDAKNRKIKKAHPNSVRLNNLLSKKLAEAEDNLLDMEVQKNDISSGVIKSKMRGSKITSFFTRANIYLADLKKQGKYNRYAADKNRVNAFKLYRNEADISFKEITLPLLNHYRVYLKAKNITERTIVNYLTIIQTLFNQAIKDGVVDSKYYPFGRDKITLKAPRSMKIGLSPDEVKALETLELPVDSYAHHARNVWLIAFYFAGMRVSDVLRLKWSDFQNDRLYYSMGKNAKAGSLKLPEKAVKIISQYEQQKNEHDLVFPDLANVPDLDNNYDVQLRIIGVVGQLNKALRDIAKELKLSKKLTMHIARHTFGNISGDKIPIQMLQKLYRHTSITTTIGYQANFIHKDADEALYAVIGF